MNKVIEYIIGAKDATGKAIGSALARLKNFATSVGRNLANIQAGFQMLGRAVSAAGAMLSKAFQFEKMTVQFKTLIGSMDEARAHMKMLQEMGDTPPFSLEQFAAASRSLMVMTDGVLGFRESLVMVGDAAAATGQPIEALAHEVGRAYSVIRDGQPITRATMALRNMGVLTPEVASKMDDMQKSGASTIEIWNELEDALKKYSGAMEDTEQTADGLIGAIQSQWDDAIREFGAACIETAKDGLGGLLQAMRELREDGSIAVWADNAVSSVDGVIESAKYVSSLFSGIWKGVKSTFGVAMAFAAGADEELANGGGLWEQMKAGGRAAKQMWNDTWNPEVNPLESQREEEIRQQAQERHAQEQADKEAKQIEEAKNIREKLAEGQRKIDERNAEAAAKKYAEEYEKAYDAWAKEVEAEEERTRIATERAIAKERSRLWSEQVKQQRLDAQALANEAADAQQRLSRAEANAKQAWGWYRNRDSWKAQLEEERANAAAEKQFEKDSNRLTSRAGWRHIKLNDNDELIRRVVLAREEEANAREYAKLTAEASERAAESLAAMEEVIVGGED